MIIGVNTRVLLEGKLEGVGLYTHEVLRRLTAMNPQDDFVFFFDRKPADTFVYGDNVTPVVLGPQARHPVLWYLWFQHSLPKAMRRHRVDLMLSTDGYMSLGSGIPTVLTIHDLAFHHYREHLPFLVHQYFNHFTPRFVEEARHILTVSAFSRRDILTTYGADQEKITVTYNGCDEAIHPLDEEQRVAVRNRYTDGNPYFIYIGSIHPRKNVAAILKAFDAFRSNFESEIKLVLAGRWAWKTSDVKTAYDNMTHRNDVLVIGHMEREELGGLLGAATGLVYPSLFEGFGIPVLEAMYADVPVITSKDTSMEEVAGDAALYVDPLKPDELTQAMERLALDSDLRNQLIQVGREQRQQFSWDHSAIKVNEVIEGIKKGDL